MATWGYIMAACCLAIGLLIVFLKSIIRLTECLIDKDWLGIILFGLIMLFFVGCMIFCILRAIIGG